MSILKQTNWAIYYAAPLTPVNETFLLVIQAHCNYVSKQKAPRSRAMVLVIWRGQRDLMHEGFACHSEDRWAERRRFQSSCTCAGRSSFGAAPESTLPSILEGSTPESHPSKSTCNMSERRRDGDAAVGQNHILTVSADPGPCTRCKGRRKCIGIGRPGLNERPCVLIRLTRGVLLRQVIVAVV